MYTSTYFRLKRYLHICNVAWGTYILHEKTTPAGYSPIADVPGIVFDATHLTYTYDAMDTRILGTVILNKSFDIALPAGSSAGFTLFDSTDTAVGAEKIISVDGQLKWENIAWGTGYYIKETKIPAGYTGLADITGIDIGALVQSYTYDRVNNRILGTVELTKNFVSLETTASFRLRGDDGYYYLTTGGSKADPSMATYQVSHTGDKITWLGLPWQGYTVEEDAINGYS